MRAIWWLVLALAGQTAALLLAEAGPFVRYQHYPFGAELLAGARPALLAVLGAQLIAVVLAGRRHLPALRAWVSAHPGRWRWLLLAVAFAGAASAPSRAPAQYAFETILSSLVQLLGVATVLLFAASLTASGGPAVERRFRRLLDGPEGGGPIDRLTLAAALWVAVAAVVLGRLSYEWLPHIPDEVAYLLQSRYMAHGLLAGRALPVQEAFTPEMVLVRGQEWASIFPPGWPALLAIGSAVGLPWLVNPLLAAGCVLLMRLLVEETHGRRTARLAVALLSVSPWFILMAMSFMSHIASTFCALLGAWAVARARCGAPAFALLAGGAVGALSLIRPLEGVMAGVILGLWMVWPRIRARGPWIVRPALFGMATIAVGLLNFPYNARITGEPRTFPIMAYAEEHYPPGANALGFGPERGFGWVGLDPLPGHGPADVVINADLNTSAVNIELFGWTSGSLVVLLLFLLLGRPAGPDRATVAAIPAIVGIQSLYWFSGGPDFGARYWYLVLIPCVVLTARGLRWLDDSVGRPGLVPASAAALALCAMLSFVPWRAIDKYRGYRGMRPGLERLAIEEGFEGDLVLVRGELHPDFHGGALLNPVDGDTSRTLYARDLPGARAALESAFPGRRIRVVDGPSVSGDGYRVVEGGDDSGGR